MAIACIVDLLVSQEILEDEPSESVMQSVRAPTASCNVLQEESPKNDCTTQPLELVVAKESWSVGMVRSI